MIERNYYLNKMIRAMGNGDVKVITGIRRSGKSVLLFELFYEYLLQQGIKEEQIKKPINILQERQKRFLRAITSEKKL